MATEQQSTTDASESGIEDGLIANAQGAVSVVHATSESVDEQLSLIRDAASSQVEDMETVADGVTELSATISLSRANEQVDRKRDRPCVVVGNLAGELDLMGESAVRENTYNNDGETLSDEDLVINVVDEATVPAQLASFYTGAADNSCRLDSR